MKYQIDDPELSEKQILAFELVLLLSSVLFVVYDYVRERKFHRLRLARFGRSFTVV